MGNSLTDIRIKKLLPDPNKRIEVWDALLPGFGVRVSIKGTKSFVLMYRFQNKLRRQTLGRYPLLSLADARQMAKDILLKVQKNEDPVEEQPSKRKSTRFAQVMDDFIKLYVERHNKPSTQRSTTRLLEKEFRPLWAKRSVKSITKSDILFILDGIVERGSPGAANHAYAAISKFFSWCAERDLIETNLCKDIKRPSKLNARERILEDSELVAIWTGVEDQSFPYEAIVKLLMLTGQRRGEVVNMQWQHLNLEERYWSLPKEMTKSNRPHTVPLSGLVMEVIASLPHQHETYLFPATGSTTTTFSGFGKCKQRLDTASGVEKWTLHDLRRTSATGMAQLGIPPHVVEKVLNHSSGTFAGVAGVYNRFGYLPEMRDALETWEQHLTELLER